MTSDRPKTQKFAAPRGTSDVLPDDSPYWQYVREAAERVCALFGYRRIETPAFEHAGVFLRGVGAGTDIVEKEVYLFEDRGGDRLALRPEGTGSIARAYIEHGMSSWSQPVRLFYLAQNFRYDRPQAGRYRQHTQFGAEAIGDSGPLIDAEVIDLLCTFYRELGLHNLMLKLNTIGDETCRPRYVDALRDYYRPRLDEVCADDRVRFEKNPMRLLDCKNERCQPVIAGAPKLSGYLCDACRDHFAGVQSHLSSLGIPFEVDERIVRGLDYYTRTAFEVVPEDDTGQQSSIGAGGRYDGLIELLGGPSTPGIGFGTGIERIIINLKRQEAAVPQAESPTLFIAHVAEEALAPALRLAAAAREAGIPTVVGGAGRSLKSQLRHANNLRAGYAAIIGANEAAAGEVTLRDLRDHTEQRLRPADIVSRLSRDNG